MVNFGGRSTLGVLRWALVACVLKCFQIAFVGPDVMIAKQGRVSWALLVLLFIFLLHSQRLSLRPQNTQSTITGLPSALDVPCSPTGGDRRPPRVPPPPPPLPLPLCDAAMLTGLLPNGTATWSTSDTNTHAGVMDVPRSIILQQWERMQ